MYTAADLPALTIERVIGFFIRSPPRSEPVVFFCEFVKESDTKTVAIFINIAKIKGTLCIQCTVLVVDICFGIIRRG